MDPKPFKVKIAWGMEATREENPGKYSLYEFESEKELEAFLYGVDEGSGWMEYAVLEEES